MTVPGSLVSVTSGDRDADFMSNLNGNPPTDLDRPTALYRFFGKEGDLLYVGITKRLRVRTTEHARDYEDTWWPLVCSRSVEWWPTRGEAGRAERRAIHEERPLHNVLHTPKHRVPIKQRVRRGQWDPKRGESLLRTMSERSKGLPFTTADAIAVSGLRKSAVVKNLQALLDRNELVCVGMRHLVSNVRGVPIRKSRLYALPGSAEALANVPAHEWVDVTPQSRSPRRPAPAAGSRRPRSTTSHWKNVYPDGRAMDLLARATSAFPGRPFTRAELAKATSKRTDTITPFVRDLLLNGHLVRVGTVPRRPGTTGPTADLLMVNPEPPYSPRYTASPRSVVIRTTGVIL